MTCCMVCRKRARQPKRNLANGYCRVDREGLAKKSGCIEFAMARRSRHSAIVNPAG